MHSLIEESGIPHYTTIKWWLFIDNSKRSLKCVLLHIKNLLGTIPISHSIYLREVYEDIRIAIDLLQNHTLEEIINVVFKIICLLFSRQSGYTKYTYFLCMWNSTACERHWLQSNWLPKSDCKPDVLEFFIQMFCIPHLSMEKKYHTSTSAY